MPPKPSGPLAEAAPFDLMGVILSDLFPGGSSDRLVALALYKAGDGTTGRNVKESLTTIALRTGLHRMTVLAALRRLKALGLVEREEAIRETAVTHLDVAAVMKVAEGKVSKLARSPKRLGLETSQTRSPKRPGSVSKLASPGLNGDHIRASVLPGSSVQAEAQPAVLYPRGDDP